MRDAHKTGERMKGRPTVKRDIAHVEDATCSASPTGKHVLVTKTVKQEAFTLCAHCRQTWAEIDLALNGLRHRKAGE
jgi:hypothetical protein